MSFANEVKDFLAGYQMVSEMGEKKKQREQDKAYNDAVLDLRRQELDLRKEEMALRQRADATRAAAGPGAPSPSEMRAQTRFDWEAEDRARAEAEREKDEAATAAIEALPPLPGEIDLEGFGVPYQETITEKPGFAEGGLVEDMRAPVRPRPRPEGLGAAIPTEEPAPAAPAAPQAPPQSALPSGQPAAPAQGQPVTQPPAEQPLPSPKSTRVVVQRAAEVGKEVMDAVEFELKTPQAAVGEGSEKTGVNFITGEGAMTPQEITALEQKIDKEGVIPPHLKTAVGMAELHNHFIEKGEPEKALRASVGYLTGVKSLTQTLGMLSMEAAQKGEVEAACRLANDACNRFPSEHVVTFTPDPRFGFTYSVKDAEGKPVEQGRLNPNQFLEVTGQIANGQAFTEQMAQFVSRHGKSGGDFGKALSGVEEAAGRLAGIDEALAMKEEGDEGYEQLVEARKGAMAALQDAESGARELADLGGDPKKRRSPDSTANIANSIRAARKAGMDMAIPFEAPAAEPADDRNWWQRNMPAAIGGQEAPQAAPAAPAAPAPATPQGNQPAGLKPAPTDVLAKAKAAIANGADPAAVAKRLTENGFSADGL